MIEIIIRFLGNLFKRHNHLGNIRTKSESFAPREWKESWWDKLKKDKLFSPIDVHSKENFKEIRIKIGKKFVIIAINIFLISFGFNLIKDTYNLIRADYSLVTISKVDFTKDIPKSMLVMEQQKIDSLEKSIKNKDDEKIKQTTSELLIIDEWKNLYISNKIQDYKNNNIEVIKNNIFSFLNNLFILYLIMKKKIKKSIFDN